MIIKQISNSNGYLIKEFDASGHWGIYYVDFINNDQLEISHLVRLNGKDLIFKDIEKAKQVLNKELLTLYSDCQK